jgi:hypothetical protein
MGPSFGTGFECDPGANWYADAVILEQSFETLEASNLGPSDFVPKLTRCATVREIMNYPTGYSLSMPNNTCEHCGGSQLISGLIVSASGGGGDVHPGLLCKEKEKGFFKFSEREKRESLFADLCTSCGTVKRLYVKDPKRDWVV